MRPRYDAAELCTLLALLAMLAFALAGALGCAPPRARDPRQQPSAPLADPAHCPAICAHLRELKCPEGEPTPGGRTCEDFCSHGLESRLVNFDEPCMMGLRSCSDEPLCSRQP